MSNLLPLIAALVPLAIAPGLVFYFDVTPKIVILVLGVALLSISAFRHLPHLSTSPGRVWFVALAAVQWTSLVVATILSTNPSLALGGSTWRRFGLITQTALLLFALLASARLSANPRELPRWLRIFCLAGVASSLYGCAQYFGFDPWLPKEKYQVGEGEWMIVRPPGTMGHAGYAATFYLHCVFAGLALLFIDRRLWSRRIGWAAAIAGSAALLLSGTRGAMLGWLVGLALLAAALRPRLRYVHAGAVALAGLSCLAFYYSPPGQKLRSRTRWYVEDPHGGARLALWQDSARMGRDRWLAGWGPEVFPSEFPRYQSRELARAFPDFHHESPHNIFLEAWTAQGFIGVAVLAGLCLLGLRQFKRSPMETALCAGLAGALVAQQFVSFTTPTALCFYFTIAIVIALEKSSETSPTRRFPALLLAPAALILAWYGATLLISDQLVLTVQRHLAAGQLREAAAVYDRVRWWEPVGVSYDLWYSRALVESARKTPVLLDGAAAIQQGINAARRATLRTEDRHNAFYNLASLCAIQNDFPGVEASLRQAIAVAPNWFKPHWALARALVLAGRTSEARSEATLAADLAGGKYPEVMQTLESLVNKK